jgi:protein-S-isoprenylcysteine O-methyltransferase Ste14
MPGSKYRRVLAVLGSALFLALAPGTVVGVIPWWISKWQVRAGLPALVWFISHLFVVTYEEPALRRTFGKEYQFYCANVPRWIPRLRAWTGS